MENNPDNRIFFDHGGLTAFDDGKNQLVKPDTVPSVQQEYRQEVTRQYSVDVLCNRFFSFLG
jgi:hypothetical protein